MAILKALCLLALVVWLSILNTTAFVIALIVLLSVHDLRITTITINKDTP